MRKTVYVFDIDSTLADNEHRASLLTKTCIQCLGPAGEGHHEPCANCGCTDSVIDQHSWDDFLKPDMMAKDFPIVKGIAVLERLRESGASIYFLTGRNRKNSENVTKAWLKAHAGWRGDTAEPLYMREDEDAGMAASVYKERALRRLITDHALEDCFFMFFEDDPHVFTMYAKYGIVVRCPEGWDHLMPTGAKGPEAAWRR